MKSKFSTLPPVPKRLLQPLSLNEVSCHMNWPARLLGIEHWAEIQRDAARNYREYNTDKWGHLLKLLKKGKVRSLKEADEAMCGDDWSVCSVGAQLYRGKALAIHRYLFRLIENLLVEHFSGSGIAELGAGYGSVVLNMAGRSPARFRNLPWAAYEFTSSGRSCMRLLQPGNVKVGSCDFTASRLVDKACVPGSLVFTCMAAMMIPRLEDSFLEGLLALAPKRVVHLEAVYEYHDPSLLGLMRQRYVEVNDYNTNLLTILKRFEQKGRIRILREEKHLFGHNPLLPTSLIVWEPVRR